ncbi:unnamed protein product [Spirodela intermedia]|uniref:Uncharacterized protein n=1 Tax=Spirodela intermedia TaxID=51605 RepID=A0A7I8JQK3_SPIIN|nr:unnamed protein product [Spirodela intermedia]CAA6671863.1 unnamed protein product [Spirodela intermedia]
MAQSTLRRRLRQQPSVGTGGRSDHGSAAAAAGRHAPSASCGGIMRLMRKLRKHGRDLLSATRPATFRCQYDPLSYSLNFDPDGLGNDSHFTFSSRFVTAVSTRPPPSALHQVAPARL